MILYILIGVAVIVAVVCIIAASQSSDFRVARSTVTSAPPEALFAQVNELRKWEAWSPWAKLDPNASNTYDGPPAGVGASFAWSGSNKVGEGKMTIVDSRPGEFVRLKLEFLRPMKATNTAEFTFKPAGGRTEVTWSMTGKKCFMAKLFGLFMDCDGMCAKMFDKGLADMKDIAESAPRETATRA